MTKRFFIGIIGFAIFGLWVANVPASSDQRRLTDEELDARGRQFDQQTASELQRCQDLASCQKLFENLSLLGFCAREKFIIKALASNPKASRPPHFIDLRPIRDISSDISPSIIFRLLSKQIRRSPEIDLQCIEEPISNSSEISDLEKKRLLSLIQFKRQNVTSQAILCYGQNGLIKKFGNDSVFVLDVVQLLDQKSRNSLPLAAIESNVGEDTNTLTACNRLYSGSTARQFYSEAISDIYGDSRTQAGSAR